MSTGVLSQSQVLLAFGVVADLFNGVRDSPAEPMDGAQPLCIRTQISHQGSGAGAAQ